jgi:caffeoyl-CoA O-methyltransferase
MNIQSKAIEKYILDHISPEDELLKQLSRQTHLKILRPRMLSGHLQGQILYMLCRMIQPKHILEIGTYTGYSAICMAKGLSKDDRIDTIEINDELTPFIQSFLDQTDLKDRINLIIGDSIDIIPTLNTTYDLIFIDGDKRQYPKYYQLAMDCLRPGGFILADNILWDGKVVDKLDPNDEYTKGIFDFNNMVKDDTRVEITILPLRDGISIIRKK